MPETKEALAHPTTRFDDAREVTAEHLRAWRAAIDEKYGAIHGIRDLPCFHVHRINGEAVLDVAPSSAPDEVARAKRRRVVLAGKASARLAPLAKRVRGMDARKQADLVYAYEHYIPKERHPTWLHESPRAPAPETQAANDVVHIDD